MAVLREGQALQEVLHDNLVLTTLTDPLPHRFADRMIHRAETLEANEGSGIQA